MMRKLEELEQECRDNGINLPEGKFGKDELVRLLREKFWMRDHQGEKMPEVIHPMLARNMKDLGDKERNQILKSTEWVVEKKYNGFRNLLYVGVGMNRCFSRNISVETYRPAENTDQLFWLRDLRIPGEWEGAVIDGEVISVRRDIDTSKFTTGKGVVTQNVLQAATATLALEAKASEECQVYHGMHLRYVMFDMIRGKGGEDLRNEPFVNRRKLLQEFVDEVLKDEWYAKEGGGRFIQISELQETGLEEFYEKKVKEGDEGVMLKHKRGPYVASSSRSKWMFKMKRFEEVDAFVTGWVPPNEGTLYDKEGLIGALEMSCFDEKGEKHVVGHISALTLEERREISVQGPDGKCCGLKLGVIGTVYEIRGQEITGRNFMLIHCVPVRKRIGVDSKSLEECVINWGVWVKKAKGEEC